MEPKTFYHSKHAKSPEWASGSKACKVYAFFNFYEVFALFIIFSLIRCPFSEFIRMALFFFPIALSFKFAGIFCCGCCYCFRRLTLYANIIHP